MTPKHLHTPHSTRLRCPVCHQAVYSRAGIHPQCAMLQADPPRPKNGARKPVDPLAVIPAEIVPGDVEIAPLPPLPPTVALSD